MFALFMPASDPAAKIFPGAVGDFFAGDLELNDFQFFRVK